MQNNCKQNNYELVWMQRRGGAKTRSATLSSTQLFVLQRLEYEMERLDFFSESKMWDLAFVVGSVL